MADRIDSYKHQGLRKKLIRVLKEKGIQDSDVLSAIERVPRHYFMDEAFLKFAYEDNAFPIAAGQTISQPFTVAYQTHLLHVQKDDKILEIGTGSGYQTCVLIEMGARVYSIERQKPLFDKAKSFLPSLGYFPKLFYGDGYKGLPTFAPFDKILVTAGAPFVPPALIDQLKIGGLLVIPVGSGNVQVMTTIIKKSPTEVEKIELDKFSFVPLLEDRN